MIDTARPLDGLVALVTGATTGIGLAIAARFGAAGAAVAVNHRHTPERAAVVVAQLRAFGRLGTPEEIADVVAFLAGPQARWIAGQVIRVDGGTV